MSSLPPPIPLKYKTSVPAEPPRPVTRVVPKTPPRGRHFKENVFRAAIVGMIVISMALAYWSFFHHLAPLQKESRDIMAKMSSLSSTVDQLERRWTPEQAQQIRAQYREVYTRLFADQTQLESWLSDLHTQASPLSLNVAIDLGPATAQPEFNTNLMVVPASVSLEIRPLAENAGDKTPYGRVLAFGQALASHGKRADLAELTVSGGVGSIQRALLVFNLWAGDLGAEVALNPQPREGQ